MICIECAQHNIDCLYSQYKGTYIRLTTCPNCGLVVDSYVEFDLVILFLDLMLWKPQAYRHLAYNTVEQMFQNNKEKLALERYRHLIRHAFLTILFEVYLNWAYEEKSERNSEMIQHVLLAMVPLQYGYFIVRQIVERVSLFWFMDVLFGMTGWAKGNGNLPLDLQRGYHRLVLLVTVLMSLAIKCLPIIMLIWPYDSSVVASVVVDVMGILSTIEALRIVTGTGYVVSGFVVGVSMSMLYLLTSLSTSFLVAHFSGRASTYYFWQTVQEKAEACRSLLSILASSIRI